MSLKYFHVLFIATTLGLMAFLAYWAAQRQLAGESQRSALVCAGAGFILGLSYLRWFLSKYRALP